MSVTEAHTELAAIQSTLDALRSTPEARLVPLVGKLRAVRVELAGVLAGARGEAAPGTGFDEGLGEGEDEAADEEEEEEEQEESSELSYIDADLPPAPHTTPAPAPSADPSALLTSLRTLEAEKWRLAFEHIREMQKIQFDERRALFAALVAARGAGRPREPRQPRRVRYRRAA